MKTKLFQLHKQYDKHDFKPIGTVIWYSLDDTSCQLYRCECGVFGFMDKGNGLKPHDTDMKPGLRLDFIHGCWLTAHKAGHGREFMAYLRLCHGNKYFTKDYKLTGPTGYYWNQWLYRAEHPDHDTIKKYTA